MQFQVCTVSPALARAWARERVPFLPVPPDPATVTAPAVCHCGEALDLEMEKGLGECVECGYKAAMADDRGHA